MKKIDTVVQDVYDVMSVCFAAEEAMNTGQSINIGYLNE